MFRSKRLWIVVGQKAWIMDPQHKYLASFQSSFCTIYWLELWVELRNFNPEIISTLMHYSTETIGPLVIKNVCWKFELETIKGWSFFSLQSNTIIDHIAIGSLIQILELETRIFFLFQLLFLSKCYAIFDLNCDLNEGTSTQKSCQHSCIILLKLLVLWWLRMCIESLSFKP